MRVQPLASTFTDNFFWLVTDADDALLVDPIDATVAIDAVRREAPSRVRILTTHGHPDHAGGNAEVAAALDARVLAPADAIHWPVPHDRGLRHGDSITLGASAFDVHHAPGHTDDHIVLHAPGILISGDVFFVAGAGNCRNGGDPGELYRTFHQRLAHLPDETRFHPGHDYASRNLAFCLHVEPDNGTAAALRERIADHARSDGPVLTTLGEERAYNPFHRVHDEVLQRRLRERFPEAVDHEVQDPAEQAFRALRHLRDSFQGP